MGAAAGRSRPAAAPPVAPRGPDPMVAARRFLRLVAGRLRTDRSSVGTGDSEPPDRRGSVRRGSRRLRSRVRPGRPAPIRIGAVYPMTGPQGAGGLDEYRGVRLAVDLVDQDGGVNGRKVVLQPLDVTGPDGGPSAIDQLAARGVKIVFGTYGSTISATAAGEVARRDMLLWETGAVGGMTGPGPGRSFFRVAPSGAGLGRSAVDFVTRELAPLLRVRTADLRFAVTNVDDTYGQEVARGALQAIRAGGLTLTGTF